MNEQAFNLMVRGIGAKIDDDARSQGIWDLGTLIRALGLLPPGTGFAEGITAPHSYRGYYERLAFEVLDADQTAGEALAVAESALGETYQGYKGGDYTMHERTLVHLAEWGRTGEALVNIVAAGACYRFETKELE